MKEFFDHVFSRIPDLDKKQTVIIGDSLTSDILGGQLAGIDTIWFNPKKKNSGEIQPTYEIERLQQLLPLLQH